ncbi:MAG: DUF4382 domain-containing protein [Nitrospirae bacterium]|nr:DUF4382 domain-containing protein [Nitrospirota bacterium]
MNLIFRKIKMITSLVLLLTGCSSGISGGMGSLSVSLTDMPTCGFDHVNVTVSKIRVHQSATASQSDNGWSDITLTPSKKIDLTSLVNGVLEDFGQTALPAGHYTQVRLVLVPNSQSGPFNNSIIPTGGIETALDTPSAVQSGIKLIHAFDVAADSLVDLALDFDACHSIVQKGNGGYALKPVVTVIPMGISGRIVGRLDSALLNAKPIVFAEQGGTIIKSTVPDGTGNFILSPLQQSSTAGQYDVVITADNHASAIIQSVPVTAQVTSTISDITNPISLNSSSTHVVNGTVLPGSAEANIRALQTFPSGPTMAVGFISANSTTGSYSLTLPTGPPSLGNYGPLPILLTADASLAGSFLVEASAIGYVKQSATVDISSGDVIHDFTLTATP